MRFEDEEFDVFHDEKTTAEKMIEAVKAAGFKASTVSKKNVGRTK